MVGDVPARSVSAHGNFHLCISINACSLPPIKYNISSISSSILQVSNKIIGKYPRKKPAYLKFNGYFHLDSVKVFWLSRQWSIGK